MAKAVNLNQAGTGVTVPPPYSNTFQVLLTDIENFFNQDNSSLYYLIVPKSEYIKPNFFENNYKSFKIKSSSNDLKQIIEEFKVELREVGLFIICELTFGEKQWITLNMTKHADIVNEKTFNINFSYAIDSYTNKNQVRNYIFDVIKKVFNFSTNQMGIISKNTNPYITHNKSEAVQKMQNFIRGLEASSSADFSTKSGNDLEPWLNQGFTTKETLQEIIKYLQNKLI